MLTQWRYAQLGLPAPEATRRTVRTEAVEGVKARAAALRAQQAGPASAAAEPTETPVGMRRAPDFHNFTPQKYSLAASEKDERATRLAVEAIERALQAERAGLAFASLNAASSESMLRELEKARDDARLFVSEAQLLPVAVAAEVQLAVSAGPAAAADLGPLPPAARADLLSAARPDLP